MWKPVKIKITREMRVEAEKQWAEMVKVIQEFQRATALPKDWRGRIIKGANP